jgi:hypothetical protein
MSPKSTEFFHGSTEHFAPGDVIKSPAARGLDNPRPEIDEYQHDRVYATPHAFVAQNYVWKKGDTEQSGPSGFIYKVKPVGQKRVDQEALRRHRIPGISYHFREAVVLSKHHPLTGAEIKE